MVANAFAKGWRSDQQFATLFFAKLQQFSVDRSNFIFCAILSELLRETSEMKIYDIKETAAIPIFEYIFGCLQAASEQNEADIALDAILNCMHEMSLPLQFVDHFLDLFDTAKKYSSGKCFQILALLCKTDFAISKDQLLELRREILRNVLEIDLSSIEDSMDSLAWLCLQLRFALNDCESLSGFMLELDHLSFPHIQNSFETCQTVLSFGDHAREFQNCGKPGLQS
jgi:hypothetical protein